MFHGGGLGHRPFFHREVGMQVNVGRLDRFVTEAQRDRGAVDAVLKQLHRRRVTQFFRGEGRAIRATARCLATT